MPTRVPDGVAAPVRVPRRGLVVVGGIPGAGKSTLLRRWRRDWAGPTPLVVRDPEDIRLRWETALAGRRAYRFWRPMVYVEHYVRLVVSLLSGRVVVLHDTATRAWTRRVVAGIARLSRRPAQLVWLDVTLAESLSGQDARERHVPPANLRRHWRRWTALRARREAGEPGFAAVRFVTRTDATLLPLLADS